MSQPFLFGSINITEYMDQNMKEVIKQDLISLRLNNDYQRLPAAIISLRLNNA